MTKHVHHSPIPIIQILLSALCSIFGTTATIAQSALAPADPPKPLTYAVVSVRPHKETSDGSRWWTPTGNGYVAKNVEPAQLIHEAYGIQCSDQLVRLPAWAYEETFDIEAKLDEDALPAYQKLSEHERQEQAALMLRPMLEDRFRLKVHHETKVLPIYALVVAKGGPKLKQSKAPRDSYGMMTGRAEIHTLGGPIGARFVVGLSDATGRIVMDKTGLTGYYDIDLKWTPDEDLAAGASGPTLFTALEEQLGLKLISDKAPVDILVVDRIERPTAN